MVGRKLGLAVTAAALALGYTSVPAVALDLGTRLTGREESALMADFARTDQQCKTGVPGDARTVAACLARNDIRKKLAFDANLCPGSTGGCSAPIRSCSSSCGCWSNCAVTTRSCGARPF